MAQNALKRHSCNEQIPPEMIVGRTHVGLIRPHNEDDYLYTSIPGERVTLIAVTDGMGGHEGGELASYLTTEALARIWRQSAVGVESKIRHSEEMLTKVLTKVNDKIFYVNDRLHVQRAMGTTVTAGIFLPGRLIIAHVGDSRAYLLRDGKLSQLTEDHTWVTKMVKLGALSPEQAENHPMSHLLSNCVGASPSIDVQTSSLRRKAGDRYLFCTDGLYGGLDPLRIQQALNSNASPQSCLDELVNLALRAGGRDNITAVVAFD